MTVYYNLKNYRKLGSGDSSTIQWWSSTIHFIMSSKTLSSYVFIHRYMHEWLVRPHLVIHIMLLLQLWSPRHAPDSLPQCSMMHNTSGLVLECPEPNKDSKNAKETKQWQHKTISKPNIFAILSSTKLTVSWYWGQSYQVVLCVTEIITPSSLPLFRSEIFSDSLNRHYNISTPSDGLLFLLLKPYPNRIHIMATAVWDAEITTNIRPTVMTHYWTESMSE